MDIYVYTLYYQTKDDYITYVLSYLFKIFIGIILKLNNAYNLFKNQRIVKS
jgi:hypothetical protein